MLNLVYISLGGNLDQTAELFRTACLEVEKTIGKIKESSSIYRTEAWGTIKQNDFLNQVILVETTLSPIELLTQLQAIEIQLGRERTIKWGPRSIDLDILYYANISAANNAHSPLPAF